MENKLKVQIWSDIMCPFCYIGKRRIEEALSQFEHKEAVAIEWKSFELDAGFIPSPDDNLIEHLAEKYRKDTDWAQTSGGQHDPKRQNGGTGFSFRKSRFGQFPQRSPIVAFGRKNTNWPTNLEELLFKAYLTDGKDLNNLDTPGRIGNCSRSRCRSCRTSIAFRRLQQRSETRHSTSQCHRRSRRSFFCFRQ